MTARRCCTSSRPSRATSCSRPVEDELFDTAIGILNLAGAAAHRAVHPPRPARALCLLPRLCAARALRHRVCASASRRSSNGPSPASFRPSTPISTIRCWRASSSSSAPPAARCRRSTPPRSSGSSPRPGGAGRTGSRRRRSRLSARPRRSSAAPPAALPDRLPGPDRARSGDRRSAADREGAGGLAARGLAPPRRETGGPGLRLYRAQGAGRPFRRAADARKPRPARRRRRAVPHRQRRWRRGVGPRIRARRRVAARLPPFRPRSEARFEEALVAVWTGRVENDGFNRLVLAAGLSARQITCCGSTARCCAKPASHSAKPIWKTRWAPIRRSPRRLVRLFEIRFDPAGVRTPRSRRWPRSRRSTMPSTRSRASTKTASCAAS